MPSAALWPCPCSFSSHVGPRPPLHRHLTPPNLILFSEDVSAIRLREGLGFALFTTNWESFVESPQSGEPTQAQPLFSTRFVVLFWNITPASRTFCFIPLILHTFFSFPPLNFPQLPEIYASSLIGLSTVPFSLLHPFLVGAELSSPFNSVPFRISSPRNIVSKPATFSQNL